MMRQVFSMGKPAVLGVAVLAIALATANAGPAQEVAHEVTVENRSGRTVYVTSTMQERGRPAYTWYAGWIPHNQARADLNHYAGRRLFVVRGTNGRVLASRLIDVNRDMTIRVVSLYPSEVDSEVDLEVVSESTSG